jgi:hypothetical protein
MRWVPGVMADDASRRSDDAKLPQSRTSVWYLARLCCFRRCRLRHTLRSGRGRLAA